MAKAHPVLRVREATGLEQKPFADATRISASLLCNVENGNRPLGLKSCEKIARRWHKIMVELDLTVLDLLRAGR